MLIFSTYSLVTKSSNPRLESLAALKLGLSWGTGGLELFIPPTCLFLTML